AGQRAPGDFAHDDEVVLDQGLDGVGQRVGGQGLLELDVDAVALVAEGHDLARRRGQVLGQVRPVGVVRQGRVDLLGGVIDVGGDLGVGSHAPDTNVGDVHESALTRISGVSGAKIDHDVAFR